MKITNPRRLRLGNFGSCGQSIVSGKVLLPEKSLGFRHRQAFRRTHVHPPL
jgi:hypothetical protein